MSIARVLATFSFLVLGGSGCAAIFTGTSQQIQITSNPPGAQAFLNGAPVGVTPVATTVKKGQTIIVTGRYPGYPDAQATLTKEFNPVSLLNLLGLVGWVVDLATGAIWVYQPETIYLQFQAPGGWGQPPGVGAGAPPGYPPPQGPAPGYPPSPPPGQGYPPPQGPPPGGYPPPSYPPR